MVYIAAVRWWGSFVLFAACSGPPPPPPSAIISITPGSVCVGDGFHTQVHVDSRGSSAELTLVAAPASPDAGTLLYDWSFSGAVCKGLPTDPKPCDVVIDPGSVDALGNINNSDVLLTMLGDRPVFVTLAVTISFADGTTGGGATSQTVIPITLLDDAGMCPQGL
jgi:hypothetical protein